PELGRGRPRRPLRTERRQLGANPLVGPAAAAGIARRRELVARRPTRADADEVACFDELREVVGGLGAADAGELLVAGARQISRVAARERAERNLLRRLELRSLDTNSLHE